MYFKHIVGHVTGYAYYATAANLDTLDPAVKKLCSANLRKCPECVYTSIAKEFIHAHMDFRYAGNSTDILRAL